MMYHTQPTPDVPHLYMGDDDEEIYPRVDELFMSTEIMEELPPKYGPQVEISKEKYISLFKPWRGALILKLLGKTVNYHVLEQRV